MSIRLNKNNERYKRIDDLQEIIERIPESISKTIILFILLLIIILFILGATINYSDILIGSATLNSKGSAINIVMPSSGKIKLLVPAKNQVKKGQILGFVQSSANIQDIILLKEIFKQYNILDNQTHQKIQSILPTSINLGEISDNYIKFLTSLQDCINEYKQNSYDLEIESNKILIESLQQNLKNIIKINKTSAENLELYKHILERDSILLSEKLLSDNEFEKTKASFLEQKTDQQEYELQNSNTRLSINSTINEIAKLSVQKQKNADKLHYTLINDYINLINKIHAWEKIYTITTPINGSIEYLQFLSNGQYIEINTDIFCVMPNEKITEVEVLMSAKGLGKVRIGQEAIVKLVDYPYKEYGTLKGKVADVFLVKKTIENEHLSLIRVLLDNENRTNYGIPIELKYSMPATVEIITQKKKLIERLFERFKYFIYKE